MIPLMRNTFLNEYETKKELSEFILKADKLSMGDMCIKFEREFIKKQGRKYSVLFNSGSSANLALMQSLKNLGLLNTNDNVGFSSLTWPTNPMSILQVGCNPIPIDCDRYTLNVMSYNLKETLKKIKLKALFITNALGFVGDLDEIRNICDENNILLIEDNCESLGTELLYDKSGNFGLASSFSFFVAHHMSTIEGGMVCTDNEELMEMLIMVRSNGWDRNLNFKQQMKWRKKFNIKSEFDAKYTFYDIAYNFRPTEITGFLGLNQLKILDENIRTRQKNHLQLEEIVKENSELITLKHDHIKTISPFAFPVICKTPEIRNKYLTEFLGADIETRPVIAGNIQNQPFYKKYIKNIVNLPETEFVSSNGFYCGNYPDLLESELDIISSCLMNK